MEADRLLPLIGNRYQLETELGRGGMGAVYRAMDRLTGQAVALKRVTTPTEQLQFASRLSSDSADSGSASLRIALAQEFQTLASLRHPNIIRVLDYGFDDERQPYLAMDLLHEPRTLLEAGRDLPLAGKINLLAQTLQALAYLHRRGIIHRDLKPDNVAVVGEDDVYVLDFGLALPPDHLKPEARRLAGTLAYMAPEVLQGDAASEASDLYAVGVMAYELLVGEHPFKASSVTEMISKVLKTEPDLTPLMATDSLTSDAGETHITLMEIVAWLLMKHPSDRYHDAYIVIADLCAAVGMPVPEESAAIRESFLQAARFVGRETELSDLRSALSGAVDGLGSLWLVGGESGVGKSRLIEELRTRALIRGVLTLRGQEIGAGALPYQLWRDPLRRLILSTDLSSEETSVLTTIMPDIAALFEDVPPFDGVDAQQRLVRTIIDLFRRQRQPILLLLEDLQWAAESLEILKRLAPFVGDLPLLIVCTYRDDERPRLRDELPQAHYLPLPRLTADEIAELSGSMLGDAGRQTEVVEFLRRETEGNSFFLVETVRALAEEAGSLGEIGQRTLPDHLMAGGVQQVIWRRINRVPKSAHGLLKLAAVIGREVDLRLLQNIIEGGAHGNLRLLGAPSQPDDLEEWLTVCANRAIFDAHDGGWRFAHDKLREALLDGLNAEESAALNQQAAEAIEAVYADDLDRHAAALAAHWQAAGDTYKEGQYTLIAAAQAHDNSNYTAAQRLYERALKIHAFMDTKNPIAVEAMLHHRLGNTLYSMSVYDAAREHQRISLELYQKLGDRKGIADSINALGESDMRQGLLDSARAQFEEALAIRRDLNLIKDSGYSYMNLGVIETQQNHWAQARDLFQRCYDYLNQAGTPRDIARALNNLANSLDVLGEQERARGIHLEALAIREQDQDLNGICYSLLNLGALEHDLGNDMEARAYVEKSLQIALQIVDRLATGVILNLLGEIAVQLGDMGAAQRYFQEALVLRRELQDRGGIVITLRELGDLARDQDNPDAALVYYRESLTLAVEWTLPAQVWRTLRDIARLLMRQEKRRQALKLLAFVRTQRDDPDPKDDELIHELETAMPPHAVASALGEALTLGEVLAKIEAGDLEI